MRLSRHTRDLGRRTLEQLRDVGATVTGIVINGVEESDGYGYGSYRYSDYQYYYKSYGHNYGDIGKLREDYFSEELAESSGADGPR
jgi:Mrp family chromosome partitioning ATPase